MTSALSRVLAKAVRVSPSLWQILILLTLGMFLKTAAVVCWDIGSATLLIEGNRLFSIGADFLWVAVLLALVGLFLWRLDRQKGGHAVRLVAGCVLTASGVLWLREQVHPGFMPDILFVLKYIFYPLLTLSFWAVVKRFIDDRFSSLKFLSLFCIELLCFAIVGVGSVLLNLTPTVALLIALFAMIGLTLVLKTIAQLRPVPPETFIRQTNGIQDIPESSLVAHILLLAFLGTGVKALIEAVLYLKLAATGIMPMTVLGLVWFLFGMLGLLIVLVLYHTRYIYTTLAGMVVFGCSIVVTGIAALGKHSGPLATGYLVFLLGMHFYLNGFMKILPRLLSGGVGARLKKRILTGAVPLGFVVAGSVCLNVPGSDMAYILIGCGGVMLIITVGATALYSRILYRMIRIRAWRKGPLMLSGRRLLQCLVDLLRHANENDVIYALRMLQEGNHPLYERALQAAVSHPSAQVRLFSLTAMQNLYRFPAYADLFRRRLKAEKDRDVKNKVLTNLILTDKRPDKYNDYLTDKELRIGACEAFLKLGGKYSEPAVSTLQRVLSSNARDAIRALSVMADYPMSDFIPFVEQMLKHPNPDVVRQALLTAGALKAPTLVNLVIRALDDPERQEAALQALVLFGKAALPPIEKMIFREQTPTLRRKQLVLFLGTLNSGEGKQILLRAICTENQKLKKNIIQSILDSKITWVDPEKKLILKNGVKKDLDRIAFLLHLREQLMNAPTHESEEAFGFLLRAVQEDIADTRELILYQLMLLEPNGMFVRAVQSLLGDSYDLYLPAMGVIQDLLPNRLYQKLKPILLLPLAQKKKNTLMGVLPEDAVRVIAEVIVNPTFVFNHWIRATALYTLRRLGEPAGLSIAEKALDDPHPVVLEAAVWALVRLQPDKKALHQKLLTIPTTRLSRIPLDEILES